MSEGAHLRDVLVFLMAAVIVVPLVQRLRASPVLGYLVAGVAIGPYGLGLIGDVEGARSLAKFGVVFLLFTIGLRLSLDRLRVIRTHIFGLGTAQVLLSGAVVGAVAHVLGQAVPAAIVLGGALALSSTALVLELLEERGELTSRFGRVSFAVLLLQDLAVVPLLALVPLLGEAGPSLPAAVGLAVVKAAAAVVIILVLGRRVFRPVFRLVAAPRSPELFVASALLVVLGTSWIADMAGLSMALGAFLAGLLIAETEYRHQVEADIEPYRAVLLGLFFTTVGMSIDVGLVAREAPLILLLVAALVVGKTALVGLLGLGFRLSPAFSLRLGLILSEGGEFAFVILGAALAAGVVSAPTVHVVLAAVALTMAATPFLADFGRRLADRLEPVPEPSLESLARETGDVRDHVIVAGFGRVGQTVAGLLRTRGVPFVAIDLDPNRVAEGRGRGFPVSYGDASRREVLRAAGAGRARAAVITLDRALVAERTLGVLRHAFPGLQVFARARDRAHGKSLEAAGATASVPETLEGSLQLGCSVLRAVGTSVEEAAALADAFRREDYARLEEITGGPPRPGGGAAPADGPPPRRKSED